MHFGNLQPKLYFDSRKSDRIDYGFAVTYRAKFPDNNTKQAGCNHMDDPMDNDIMPAILKEADKGVATLGIRKNFLYRNDPKLVMIGMSRYKFVGKMLEGREDVLEVGCGDGFNAPVVAQHVGKLSLSDIDENNLEDIRTRDPLNRMGLREIFNHNFVSATLPKTYDAIYLLDVFEHIDKNDSHSFLTHLNASLTEHGTVIIGIPSLESQKYASKYSRAGHVNCMTKNDFKTFLETYYHNVFMFSMNDEVVHTGYGPMSQYLIAVACSKRAA